MVDTNSRRRVKLYMLNADRAWDDRGTGHISSMYAEKYRGMCLQVRSEEDGGILMESKIQLHTAYQKQQDTLIVWSEQDNDYALSFQEKAGCDEIWEKICQEQGCNPAACITQEVVMEPEGGEEMAMDDEHSFEDMADAAQLNKAPVQLPPCDLCKLEEISDLIKSFTMMPTVAERLTVAIENEGYVRKLLDLFHMCEDLEHTEGLHHLYDIFDNLFKLNKNALFEIMFADDTIFDVIGVLEYNPHKATPRVKHREYLRTQAKFKEVIPLNNPDLVQRIHQTYRIQYIHDVILPTPSMFEETMLSTLTSYIYFNKAEIVSTIQEDKAFLQQLFAQIVDDEVDDDKRRDLVLFLKEFCIFSQPLQPNSKDTFFKTLTSLGVMGALEIVLGLDDCVMKNAALDIFSHMLECNPSMVREFIIQEAQQQDDEDLLINLVIEQMISDDDPELGGAMQLMGIIRILVDPENMLGATNKIEKTEFLGFFYKHSMHVLTAPLFANTVDTRPSKDDYQTAQLLSIILELLTFCIERHSYHVRNYILQKDLIRRVLVLLKSRHAFLALSSLRLVRRVVGLKDEFYNRYLVKGDLLAPIVTAFTANGNKYNLLNSAMIELFDFIRVDDNKTLINYVVESHFSAFEPVSYVTTFKELKNLYEQHKCDGPGSDKPTLDSSTPSILRSAAAGGGRLRRDARSLDEDEEMWFDQEDDFDDDSIMPMAEMLKSRVDSSDFEQMQFDKINKYLERNRLLSNKDSEVDRVPRLQPSTGNININLSSSPVGSPRASSPTTPQSSPTSSPQQASRTPPVSTVTTANGDTDTTPTPATTGTDAAATTVSSATSSPSSVSLSSSVASTNTTPATTTTTTASTDKTSSDTATTAAAAAPAAAAVKKNWVGLVDYPDEDSDEEEEEDSAFPSPKRQRLST